MKTLKFAVAAVVAAASAGFASLATTPAATNQADCPYGCLTGDGTHFNGTICMLQASKFGATFTRSHICPEAALAASLTLAGAAGRFSG